MLEARLFFLSAHSQFKKLVIVGISGLGDANVAGFNEGGTSGNEMQEYRPFREVTELC